MAELFVAGTVGVVLGFLAACALSRKPNESMRAAIVRILRGGGPGEE